VFSAPNHKNLRSTRRVEQRANDFKWLQTDLSISGAGKMPLKSHTAPQMRVFKLSAHLSSCARTGSSPPPSSNSTGRRTLRKPRCRRGAYRHVSCRIWWSNRAIRAPQSYAQIRVERHGPRAEYLQFGDNIYIKWSSARLFMMDLSPSDFQKSCLHVVDNRVEDTDQ
jgi:hypothetical protein